jgi:hypothetical protein
MFMPAPYFKTDASLFRRQIRAMGGAERQT